MTQAPESSFNPFRALRYGDYRFVWSSETLNLWASEMETIVLAIFVLRDTGSPLLVGLIGALKFGGTLLGPFYGLMVDRFDRKRLQVGVRVIGLSLALVLTSLIVADRLVLWHAYVIVSAGSMVRMLDIVLVQALTADAVPAGSLHGAIGLSRFSLDGARVAGSLAGGVIFEVLGLDWAYAMITVLYLLATLASMKIDRREVTVGAGLEGGRPGGLGVPGIRAGLAEGLRHVLRSKVLPGLIFFSFLIEFSAFPIVNGLMTVIGDELYGLGGAGIGLLAAAASGGALSGALALGVKRNIGSPALVMVLGSAIWHVLMLVLALSLPLWGFSLVLFAWGFCGGMTFVAMVVGLLRAAPAEYRGRVMGIRTLGIYGLPIGLLVGGWIAEEVGARAMIGVLGGIGFVATLVAALAVGTPLLDAARLANVAAGIVVGKVGTAVAYPDDIADAIHRQTLLMPGEAKFLPLVAALDRVAAWRQRGDRIGFTNGCFDLIHPGHVVLLAKSRAACDRLIVGLNADSSVRRLKGETRPVQNEASRAAILASLESVDLVVLFAEDTPVALIEAIKPDILAKGADYTIDQVVGADLVRAQGGEILLVDLEAGHSTSATIAGLAK